MNNMVITIARSYGSGGRRMGKLLAQELGFAYYDREILSLASNESGISEDLFRKMDETARMPLFRIAREMYTGEVIPPDSDDFISNENLFRYQAKIIRELAASHSCVIVGRCANYILRGRENVCNLFVSAPVVD
ncbi:MAG: cytidylate kinase-like family protein, partial [Clostridia bacterium]|nr:cytidylate kinase-like family protein [Clostridia bacterium]